MTRVRSAIWVPLFDELADPAVVVRLAVEAEEHGWDGFFVWDHVRWREPVEALADPWVTLSAVAAATSEIRIGPMVTALARRRPQVVARQTASLDLLSGGRLVLGAGLGSDRFGGEFSRFGDEVDDRTRAAMLDEGLAILRDAWSGEPVRHRGEHHVVDDVRFLPRPVRGTVPVWIAGFPSRQRPLQRAARYDGFVPVNLAQPEQLAEAVATIGALREDPTTPYDVAVTLAPDADLAGFEAAGMTWWLTDVDPHGTSVADVRAVLRDGPLR
ncbi:alkanesulfonate monooxygenase SsuD/methylene tetrahydromethanopterin reductase-like flavin-dependent oxidoreductase (luciferase family) [Nocardioides aromaticivorans]|uniref:Alkanesulfonate monooxygenase SsuD/methylene tetrahydromethanopterin reductase-like flavin-dependent oxidoreductase (Luciferase family) n=1 Tax=Nocardioides aromaticivorans TaxID=200618 RepID=A0A7Y9ZIE4_9ACTN|nr:LLM class flavin-dependent oxidoreductase [Nocardioides aromaticivorans]NYI45982.1 alkanesulfonate monooxygenase SsuD/methylene tetrahydromethanopterin reductase-like flavin-dependent oxidoreductase (luciferase family) [Nocardioides aromaticivorans]